MTCRLVGARNLLFGGVKILTGRGTFEGGYVPACCNMPPDDCLVLTLVCHMHCTLPAVQQQLQGATKRTPPHKNLIIFRIINIFGELFRGYLRDILPSVLQILAFLL